ncbi:isochorismatase family protein [Microbacterium gorillae]|uniref:isochorismatase family protein n=1 Tax=Microbacterium gorillae TaxID=1231063 RepID=UPI00058B3DCA|nr:isochorismatase family protein [Microbacterium gorillae]
MPSPRRALVIIDVQQEYFHGPLTIQYPPREESLERILDALGIAEERDIPVVVVQHENPAEAAAFASGSARQELHPKLAERLRSEHTRIVKRFASAFDGTTLANWCQEREADTLTLVGYMTNNCILATAAAGGPHDLAIEVLSDATGAINLSNEIGTAPARQVHETLMTLLHSNLAAVTTTTAWAKNVRNGIPCAKSNLISSASYGENADARGSTD